MTMIAVKGALALDHHQIDIRTDFKLAAPEGEWATFTGIASTVDTDLMGDVIESGAFEPINPATVALLYSHDPAEPVGKWESFRQVGKQLVAKGKLLLSVSKGREVYALLKNGVLTGLSVGFRIEPNGVREDGNGRGRRITKALLLECSLVTVPANMGARITEVRSGMNPLDINGVMARINDLDRQGRNDSIAALKRIESLYARAIAAVQASQSASS